MPIRKERAGLARTRKNSQEVLVCVNLARSRPTTAQGKLVKACQVPDENPGADEGPNLLGVTLVLPAIQSIELPRDYSRAEQAIAKPGQGHRQLTEWRDADFDADLPGTLRECADRPDIPKRAGAEGPVRGPVGMYGPESTRV